MFLSFVPWHHVTPVIVLMAGTGKASVCLETTGSPRSVANDAKFAERERQTEGKREMLGTTEKRVRKQLL